MRSKPLKDMPKYIEDFANFGFKRKFDVHTGIDLHCQPSSEVFAIEDGVVLKIKPFTGTKADSPWWEDTDYLGVLSPSGYIVYGEIEALVKEGDKVKSGQLIGKVKRVLKKDKNKPMDMLHLEFYTKETDPVIWALDSLKPLELLNPWALIKEFYE